MWACGQDVGPLQNLILSEWLKAHLLNAFFDFVFMKEHNGAYLEYDNDNETLHYSGLTLKAQGYLTP